MGSEPILFTADEASLLKAAMNSIVSMGIHVQDTEQQIPAVKTGVDGLDAGSSVESDGPPEEALA